MKSQTKPGKRVDDRNPRVPLSLRPGVRPMHRRVFVEPDGNPAHLIAIEPGPLLKRIFVVSIFWEAWSFAGAARYPALDEPAPERQVANAEDWAPRRFQFGSPREV